MKPSGWCKGSSGITHETRWCQHLGHAGPAPESGTARSRDAIGVHPRSSAVFLSSPAQTKKEQNRGWTPMVGDPDGPEQKSTGPRVMISADTKILQFYAQMYSAIP
jgi:hypothetical protein